jgi:beta-1,2-mannobiose phosphorylase / 1,2-beta-oligomannan phosphorylase
LTPASRSRTPITTAPTRPFGLNRLGVLMEPNEADAHEACGVLNPACPRGPDGALYLFPRLVAAGNYSRIGVARVHFDTAGDPISTERLGIALEPTEPYEKNPVTSCGCEDPGISWIEELGRYVMTYAAFSPVGPRIALAVSTDLFAWDRPGVGAVSRTAV